MTIQVACPNCGREYQLNDDNAGRDLPCEDCSSIIAVPVTAVEDSAQDAQEAPAIFIQLKDEPATARIDRFNQSVENRGGILYKILVVGGGILLLLAFRVLRNMNVDGTFGRKPPGSPEAPDNPGQSDYVPPVLPQLEDNESE